MNYKIIFKNKFGKTIHTIHASIKDEKLLDRIIEKEFENSGIVKKYTKEIEIWKLENIMKIKGD